MRIMADQARIINLDEETQVNMLTEENAAEVTAALLERINGK